MDSNHVAAAAAQASWSTTSRRSMTMLQAAALGSSARAAAQYRLLHMHGQIAHRAAAVTVVFIVFLLCHAEQSGH